MVALLQHAAQTQSTAVMTAADAQAWRNLHFINQITWLCECPICSEIYAARIRGANLWQTLSHRPSALAVLWRWREARRTQGLVR